MKALYNNAIQAASKYQFNSYFIAYSFILFMIGAGYFFKEREIILPELVALSIGCLVYKKDAWLEKTSHIFLLPSLTAILGYIINLIELSIFLKVFLVLTVMFLLLHMIKSKFAPAIATGLLPIITNCNSYVFLVSILFFTGLLAVMTATVFKKKGKSEGRTAHPKPIISTWGYLLILTIWLFFCYIADAIEMAAIPPVIVVGYETIAKREYHLRMLYKQLLALVSAAFIGAQSIYYLDNYLLAALFDFAFISIILRILKLKMPPAYAMSILPMILPHYSRTYFAIDTAIMLVGILGPIYVIINSGIGEINWAQKIKKIIVKK
ncbi:hypothetical protein [Flavobacterium sp. 3-210]